MEKRILLNVNNELQSASYDEVKNIQDENADDNIVVALNSQGGINVGTMMRTSCIFGVGRFILLGKMKYMKKATVGADKYIKVSKYPTWDSYNDFFNTEEIIHIITDLKRTHTVLMIEQGGEELSGVFDAYKMNKNANTERQKPIAFVVGNENTGIPQSVIDIADKIVSIPQVGVIRSHNVAMALSMVLWEFYR